jgi:hypothetical protein
MTCLKCQSYKMVYFTKTLLPSSVLFPLDVLTVVVIWVYQKNVDLLFIY